MMRLLLGMGLSPRTAADLRRRGYDADHVTDRGPNTMTDVAILSLAQAERRVVITFDLDFPQLLAVQRSVQASVVLFRVVSANTERITDWLLGVLPRYRQDLTDGAVLVLDGRRERLRYLPLWEQ